MYYTYVIETVNAPKHWYVGSTEDLPARLVDHNAGRSPPTSKYRPWKLRWYCAFENRTRAEAFETYLKTASGRAFQKKHLG
jgi:predicted GIY-YIG superfamily endonuclease